MNETDPTYLANNMNVIYNYVGEGNVVQAKFGLGCTGDQTTLIGC